MKMKKISEIVTSEPAFPDTTPIKKEDILKKPLKINAIAHRVGDSGDFFIICAECEQKTVSFSCGGKVVMDKLNKVLRHYKVLPDDKQVSVLPECVEATVVQVKSKEGRMYDDLE